MSQNCVRGTPICDVCRTINLSKHIKEFPKPDLQVYEKCKPRRLECGVYAESPLTAKCIKVCTKEEYLISKGRMKIIHPYVPYYPHGKLLWIIKLLMLYGALRFTYNQGVWGTQYDVSQCWKRWREYYKSFFTRRPPRYDSCGRIIPTKGNDSLLDPFYMLYKNLVTQAFQGLVKLPVLLKCTYVNYLKQMKLLDDKDKLDRQIMRTEAKQQGCKCK